MKLLFENIKSINATYEIEINFDNDDSNFYKYKFTKLHPFVFGNDDDNDIILYPENVKIEFSLIASNVPIDDPGPFSNPPMKPDYEREYYRLINIIAFDESSVIIKKNGIEYFRGFIDKQYKKTSWYTDFELLIISDFAKLKNISPKTELLGLNPNSDDKILYTEVCKKIIELVIPINEVVFESELKVTTNFTFLDEPWDAPATNLGNFVFNFVGSITPHETMISLLKEILQTFGCLGIVKDNKFIMQPRGYYSGAGLVTINSYLDASGPAVYQSQKLSGLILLVRGADSIDYFHEVYYGNVETDESGRILNEEEIEYVKISTPGGDPPGIDGDEFPLMIRNLWAWVPEFIAGIGNAQWTVTKRNEFYTTNISNKAPLWKIIGDSIWAVVKNSRLVFQTSLLGINWAYNTFYQFVNSNYKLRARKLYYDEFADITELDLIDSRGDYSEYEPLILQQPETGIIVANNIYGEVLNHSEFLENNLPTNFKFIPGTTKLHRNGLRLKLNNDYNEGEDFQSITLTIPAHQDDILLIDYIKQKGIKL